MVVEDRHSTPADIAAFRVDFRAFLFSLSRRDRRVAIKLAKGHGTKWVARRFDISQARVEDILLLTADRQVAAYPGPIRRI